MEIFQNCVSQITLCISVFASPIITAGYSKLKKWGILIIAIFALVFSVFNIGMGFLYRMPDVRSYAALLANVMFLVDFLGATVCVKLAFDCNIFGACFCGVAGYCVQHIQSRVGDILIEFLLPSMGFWANWVIYLSIMLTFYFIFYLVIRRSKKIFSFERIHNRWSLVIAALVIFMNIFYNTFGITYAISVNIMYDAELGDKIKLFVYIVSLIFALLAIMLAYSTFTNYTLSDEKERYAQLLVDMEEKYKAERENIELINIKCHDLKHFLQNNGNISESDRQEIIDSINIYDSGINTGNEALDVLLAQKLLYCHANDIKLTCLVNGRPLDFLKPSEVYALFGNALDNAVEYVSGLPKEKRIISLTELPSAGDLLRFRVENWYEGDIAPDEAIKTKKDKRFHGFGIKSMQMAVGKYNGSLAVEIKDNTFTVNISLLKP